jgi:hypothetical protein
MRPRSIALAGTGVFGKQSPGPALCDPLALGRQAPPRYAGCPFSRSYGANLPSSLAGVLPSTSVCSTSPPVSVCGTVAARLARSFSRRSGFGPFGSARTPPLPVTPQVSAPADLPTGTPYGFGGPRLGPRAYPPASLRRSNAWRRDGNLNPLSIACAFRPRLRPASPAADQPGCGTLGHPVGGIRTPLALLMPTFALPPAPGRLPPPLHCRTGRSPTTPERHARASAASVPDLSPGGLSAPRHGRPVSYYALFQGWLLLSQPPGCLRAATALPT